MADIQLGYTAAQLNTLLNKLNNLYPVGSIYMSVNNTDPSTLYGGTWERIQDTFLLAAGSTYAAGGTGGEATHILTTNEIPSHTHTHKCWIYNGSNNSGGQPRYGFGYSATGVLSTGFDSGEVQHYNMNAGGDAAHNNMPPYLAVYVWKRTA